MQYIITCPEHIDTSITLPASKSISNRALIIQALTKGGMMPENLSDCDDTEVIIRGLSKQSDVIDIKAAGTAMRFMNSLSKCNGWRIYNHRNGTNEASSDWYSRRCTTLFRGRD